MISCAVWSDIRPSRCALTLLADRLNRLTAFTEHVAFLDVTGRMAAVLLELAEHHGVNADQSEIGLHLTRQGWPAAG